MTETIETPYRVMGLYDKPFWDSLQETRTLKLQRCTQCGAFRYPPGPTCHSCVSTEYEWVAVGGGGEITSWVVFHKQYLPAYAPPYNAIAVKLDEGPTIISNLEDETPEGNWIGQRVKFVASDMPDGVVLPRFVLDTDGA